MGMLKKGCAHKAKLWTRNPRRKFALLREESVFLLEIRTLFIRVAQGHTGHHESGAPQQFILQRRGALDPHGLWAVLEYFNKANVPVVGDVSWLYEKVAHVRVSCADRRLVTIRLAILPGSIVHNLIVQGRRCGPGTRSRLARFVSTAGRGRRVAAFIGPGAREGNYRKIAKANLRRQRKLRRAGRADGRRDSHCVRGDVRGRRRITGMPFEASRSLTLRPRNRGEQPAQLLFFAKLDGVAKCRGLDRQTPAGQSPRCTGTSAPVLRRGRT